MLALGVMFAMKDSISPVFMVIPVITYVGAFATGVGVVIWVYLSEMFPTKIRGTAMGIATMIVWTANFIFSQFFPILQAKMGGSVFYLFAGICLFAFIFTVTMMRETKGLQLEEVDGAFVDKGDSL
jgi:MFS family permease